MEQHEHYVLIVQHPGESALKADISVYHDLKSACDFITVLLDEPHSERDAKFDDGRWLVTSDDIWVVIFKQ